MQAAAVDLEINLDRKAFLVEKEKKGFFDRRRGRHDSNFQTAADEKGFELFRQEQYNKQTEFDRRTHSSARSSPCRDYQYHGTSHRDADERGSEFKQPRYDRRTHASAQLSYTDDHQYHGSSRRGAGERGSEFQQPRYDDRRTHALTQTSYADHQYHGNSRGGADERGSDQFRREENKEQQSKYYRTHVSNQSSYYSNHQYHGKRKRDVLGRHGSRDNSSNDDDEERYSRREEQGNSGEDYDDGSENEENGQARGKEDTVFNPFHDADK